VLLARGSGRGAQGDIRSGSERISHFHAGGARHANRKPATTVYERAALLDSMVSYTGRYVVEGDRIWIKVDVAWNEIFTGTEQIRYFTLDNDNLRIRTAPQLSAI